MESKFIQDSTYDQEKIPRYRPEHLDGKYEGLHRGTTDLQTQKTHRRHKGIQAGINDSRIPKLLTK